MRRSGSDSADEVIEVDVRGLAGSFTPPTWLRDLGLLSWLVVGVGIVGVGAIWVLGETSAIVVPVILGTIIGAVAGPSVSALQRRGLPRPAGAALVLLGVILAGVLIALLVIGGLTSQASSVSAAMQDALTQVEQWLKQLGIDQSDVKQDLEKAVPAAGSSLLTGVEGALSELSSVVAMVTFAAFSTFFILKDGPSMRRWVNAHMGVPEPVARVVTGDTLKALRAYFLGVTIVAAFNAVVIGLGALVLGVPLAGTIAVLTFVAAYVPFIGAWVAGIFAVALALAGTDTQTAAAMAVIALLANGLLQQVVQPIAFGATLSLNPLVVLIVTIGGGALFGMVGLVLSAPLTSAIVNIVKDLDEARRADAGSDAPPPPAPG